jgi:hypothetical protein
MALSNNTINRLADALVDDVVSYIEQDERFFDLMIELIPDAIADKLGCVDINVAADLSMCIAERLHLTGD